MAKSTVSCGFGKFTGEILNGKLCAVNLLQVGNRNERQVVIFTIGFNLRKSSQKDVKNSSNGYSSANLDLIYSKYFPCENQYSLQEILGNFENY